MSMKYKLNTNYIVQKIEKNKIIFFDSTASTIYTLNETGSTIFSLLKKGFSPAQISVVIAKKYEVDKMQAKKDCESFFKSLLQKKVFVPYSPKLKKTK